MDIWRGIIFETLETTINCNLSYLLLVLVELCLSCAIQFRKILKITLIKAKQKSSPSLFLFWLFEPISYTWSQLLQNYLCPSPQSFRQFHLVQDSALNWSRFYSKPDLHAGGSYGLLKLNSNTITLSTQKVSFWERL